MAKKPQPRTASAKRPSSARPAARGGRPSAPQQEAPKKETPKKETPAKAVPTTEQAKAVPTAEQAARAPEPVPEQQPAPEPGLERRPQSRRLHVRASALIGVLLAVLGFAIAVQVRANSSSDSLSNLREEDLIGILDNQNARADRLRRQIADLQQTLTRLRDSGDQSAAARQQAKQDAEALGILLGTLPATGPGVEVTVTDPQRRLRAEDLLDVVEELRGAGAEAIEFAGVRVSTDTAFRDVDGDVSVDGVGLAPPYRVVAIGEATTLDTALNIPGGVAATVRAAGGDLTVDQRARVTITSTRSLPETRYVKPATR